MKFMHMSLQLRQSEGISAGSQSAVIGQLIVLRSWQLDKQSQCSTHAWRVHDRTHCLMPVCPSQVPIAAGAHNAGKMLGMHEFRETGIGNIWS